MERYNHSIFNNNNNNSNHFIIIIILLPQIFVADTQNTNS